MPERPKLQQLLDRLFPSGDKKEVLNQFIERVTRIREVEKVAFGMAKSRGGQMMPTIIVVSGADNFRIKRLLPLLSAEYCLEDVDVGWVRKERYPKDRADFVLWDRSRKSPEV